MKKTQISKKFKKEHNLLRSPWFKNKLINCGIYIIGLFVILLINYLSILGFKPSIWILLDLLLMIFFVSPIFFFKGTMFDRIYLPIIFGIVTVFITININYYKFFHVIFTLKDLKNALHNLGKVGQYSSGLDWTMICVNIVLLAIFITGLLIFNIKFNFKENSHTKNPIRKNMHILGTAILGGSLLIYEFSMGMWVVSETNKNIKSIKFVNYNANYHFKKMGMISYYNREIRQLLTDKGVGDKEIISYLENPKLVKDAYTGLLTNPNIFIIMIETGDKMMVNEYTTPNLWKLFKGKNGEYGGVFGEHNYSYNHTNVANQIAINGSYPLSPLDQKSTYNIPFNLPHILKQKNYNTRYYYDSIEKWDSYGDMKFIPTLGFDHCFWHNDIIPDVEPWSYEKLDFTRDSIVADGIIKNLKEYRKNATTPFYAHWMTMHMHMNQVITDGNKELINGLYDEFGSKLKQYEALGLWTNPCTTADAKSRYEIYTLKTMDFDKALGNLMKYFYESGDEYLKNTLFIAFGDHVSYEVADGKYISQWAKNIFDDDNLLLYSTVLGFYHPLLNDKILTDTTGLFDGYNLQKLSSPACITPTILDLMGIVYNEKLYQGQSIFSLNNLQKYDKSLDDVYYSAWLNLFMNENYSSNDGAHISKIVNDNNTKNEFITKVEEKQNQLRILESIYHKKFFDNHKYEEFIPINTFTNKINEYAIVNKNEM